MRGAALAIALLLWAVAPGAAAPVAAADAPTIRAQLAAAHLPEPLVATGPTTTAADAALLRAVEAWDGRTNPDDFSSLDGFLAAYPQSAWRVAVLTNLGIVYRHYGYLSRALDAWRAAWEEGRGAAGPKAHALVDRAVGELVALEAELGQKEALAATLKEIGARPVTGPGTALVEAGRDTLWVMNTDPKHLYNCGPLALKTLLLARHASPKQVFFLNWVKADGPKGTSLAEVMDLAKKAHADLVPIFRKPGEPVPVPSIAHFRVGHFAAIVGEANGRYHIEDPTLGRQGLWMTPAALDAESSGYFLVPAREPQASQWRKIAASEAGRVWGAGQTTDPPPDDPGPPADPPPDCDEGMCQYGISELAVGVTLVDHPVGYVPPKGPSAKATLSYNQWEAGQPANFSYSNVGHRWALNWLTYIEDDPTTPGTNVSRYLADGSRQVYTGYDSKTRQFAPEEDDASILVLEKTSPIVYERFLKNGTIETYSESDDSHVFPRNVFLSRIADPQGNTLTLDYGKIDGQVRLVSLTDATGRKTTFGYGSRVSPLLITRITDPFGRSAELGYDAQGRLGSITDVLGLTSKFTYDASSVIVALTTPYGTTRFAYGAAEVGGSDKRFVNATDPLGYGEREETFQPASFLPNSERQAPTLPAGYPPYFNNYLQYRDSFHWNKHQYAVAGCTARGGCNYADARQTHFTHDPQNISIEWYTIESRKEPLESRVWYTYPGQPLTGGLGAGQAGTFDRPDSVARVLDNGETQLSQLAYNAFGNPTRLIDPVGRTTTYTYAANRIDVSSIAQSTSGGPQTVARFTYNDRHEPLSYTDAAGETTHYAYNAAGQPISVTNPLGERTTFAYDGAGDLVRIVDADGKVAAIFTYDSFDRVASYTDAGGHTVKYEYDAANRLTRATYPDGTSETYTYNRLDHASYSDRQGHLWSYAHDADRRLVAVTDPLGHAIRYGYYENGAVKSLMDPDGHTTNWAIDIEGRPTAKIFADGSGRSYQYENTISRLKSVTDALGQIKTYEYTLDNRLAGESYLNALHATPDVVLAWDRYFPRLVAMEDGTGTTTYSYVAVGKPGALRLSEESTPLPNGKTGYSYDALGRVTSRAVGGAPPESFAYDRIDRLVRHTDALGEFATSYLGETGQPDLRRLVGGRVATAWSYLPNSGDRRLAGIDNEYPNERQFRYTTTPDNLVAKIVELKSKSPLQSWSLGYDKVNRLTSAVATVAGRFGYGLDPAGNITGFASPSGTTTAAYNRVNELAELGGKPLVWDADGDLVSDGVRTFSWDAEQRLIGVGEAGLRVSFAYDGLDRRVAITTTKSGKTTATRYLWCGRRICQSRLGAETLARLYYPEGEVIPGKKPADDTLFYYGPDQLGSVRDVYARSPVFSMVQQYDYDPYGKPIKTPATGPFPDFRYAGMLYPDNGAADAGLYLTQYRAYDPTIGRWLTRDPSGERLGPNLFAYAGGNPVSFVDHTGLQSSSGLPYGGFQTYPQGSLPSGQIQIQQPMQTTQTQGSFSPGETSQLTNGTTAYWDPLSGNIYIYPYPNYNPDPFNPGNNSTVSIPPGSSWSYGNPNLPGPWGTVTCPPIPWDTAPPSNDIVTPGLIDWLGPGAQDSSLFGDPGLGFPTAPDPGPEMPQQAPPGSSDDSGF